ncbi:hypothetical protein HOY82DRAFT_489232 [Tuber indicum]|nr:hypothetical protein HOY82DRAFT_489232 [Tuber indicum]
MPPNDRSAWRNAFIYASDNRSTILGGLWTAEGITNANLYSMIGIFCLFSDTFDLHDESEQLVERDLQPLQPGNYYIVTEGFIAITDEVPLTRTTSVASGTRIESFRDSVRSRDRGCVLTRAKAVMAHFGYWTGFEATHIFPLAYEEHWNRCNYDRWITTPPANESDGSINSLQNGILLRSDMREYFDNYHLAIDPDDNYKIVCFSPAPVPYNIAGRSLDPTFLNNTLRPSAVLLRWHFRQAVLTNVKGQGEPCFETDLPPGSDIMGKIMGGPKSRERMEFELFSRFNSQRIPEEFVGCDMVCS